MNTGREWFDMQNNVKDDEWQESQVKNDEVWDRKDTLIGKYISVQSEVGPNKSNMYTLKNEDGTVGVWGSTVIDGKFKNIPIGSMVKIEPRGENTSKAGKNYMDFGVYFVPPKETIQDPFDGLDKVDHEEEAMPDEFLQ